MEQPAARVLQNGTHIARIVALEQPDGTFEAQVFVRLAREPGIAETYIPAGIFPAAEQAWDAATARATWAIDNHEF